MSDDKPKMSAKEFGDRQLFVLQSIEALTKDMADNQVNFALASMIGMLSNDVPREKFQHYLEASRRITFAMTKPAPTAMPVALREQ